MQLLAQGGATGSFRRMSDEDTWSAREAEQALMGKALKALRERLKLTQGEAGAGCSPRITSQAWQKYEGGERKFGRDTLERLTRAIGSSVDQLLIERARILGEEPPAAQARGFQETPGNVYVLPVWGRAKAGAAGPQVYDAGEPERYIDLRNVFGPSSRVTTIAGESMTPWANSGSLIVYDVDTWPRREEGCLVELHTGEMLVKLYKKVDGSTLFVEELHPDRRELRFALKDVKGVYAVTFRGN